MPLRLDPYSLAAIAVDQKFNDTLLRSATAFVWQRNSKLYLISNWHVVTCRNSDTSQHLRLDAAEPNNLVGHFRLRPGSFETQTKTIPLRDAQGKSLWLHYPASGNRVDVVAIPLSDEYQTFTSLISSLPIEPLSVQIGMDVFVLGFPFRSAPPALPVWKRGSIASEPNIVRQAASYYLVDTASRPGMSGAPVILRSYGARLTESGTSIKDEPGSRFFGVYSGRLRAPEDDAQLARVWPASFITDVIDANVRDPGGC
jgi:hypothetical protein